LPLDWESKPALTSSHSHCAAERCTVFVTPAEQQVAQIAYDAIRRLEIQPRDGTYHGKLAITRNPIISGEGGDERIPPIATRTTRHTTQVDIAAIVQKDGGNDRFNRRIDIPRILVGTDRRGCGRDISPLI